MDEAISIQKSLILICTHRSNPQQRTPWKVIWSLASDAALGYLGRRFPFGDGDEQSIPNIIVVIAASYSLLLQLDLSHIGFLLRQVFICTNSRLRLDGSGRKGCQERNWLKSVTAPEQKEEESEKELDLHA